MSGPLGIERRGSVAILTLDRPAAGNAIDVAMADALLDAAIALAGDPSVRAVVLTGTGAMFCAGGDVAAFAAAGDAAPTLMHRLTTPLHAAIARLVQMEAALVTAINGAAAGAGLGLAMLGDVALAARSAKFATAYGGIGLTPDAGTTWLLPRLVGLRQAQRLTLGGERIDAAEAAQIGLVSEVVDDTALMDRALESAARLAAMSGSARRVTRTLLFASFDAGLETQLAREATAIAQAAGQADGREGIAAFTAKRRPIFG